MHRAFFLFAMSLLPAVIGCSEREPPTAVMPVGQGDAARPLPAPRFDPLLVGDQTSFKASQAAPAAGADVSALIDAIPKSKFQPVPATQEDTTDSADDDDSDSEANDKNEHPSTSSAKAGEDASEPADGGDKQAAPSSAKSVTDLLLDQARPELSEVPPNPENRPSQGVEMARKAAVAAATRKLLTRAMRLEMDETTLGAALLKHGGVEVVKPGALEPKGVRVVAMKWKNADTLEVEVEISLGDLLTAVAAIVPKLDLDSLHLLGDEKCLAAKGAGAIPQDMRASNKALPGERAKEMGEGGGL